MELYLETTATDGSDAAPLYAFVVDGDVTHLGPAGEEENTRLDLEDGRVFIGGSLNGFTGMNWDRWEIDGEITQFDQTSSDTTNISVDDQPVDPSDLGGHDDQVWEFPTGPIDPGETLWYLYTDGAGVEPMGTYTFLLDGEFDCRTDWGEMCFEVGDGWYVMHGHVAGWLDVQQFTGSVEKVEVAGAPLNVEFREASAEDPGWECEDLSGGPSATWSDVISQTGGSGRVPADDEPDPDPSASVVTAGTDGVTETAATLVGDLTEMQGLDEVVVFFMYGDMDTQPTDTQGVTLDSSGEFQTTVTGLDPGETYEFRAMAYDGTTGEELDTGDVLTFTTDGGDTPPDEPDEPAEPRLGYAAAVVGAVGVAWWYTNRDDR